MDATMTATVHPDYNLVEPCDGCPHCGETRVDWLRTDGSVWRTEPASAAHLDTATEVA